MVEFPTTWERRGEPLGYGTAREYMHHGVKHIPSSIAFVCYQCGDLWARITVRGQRFFTQRRLCPTCGPGFIIPTDIENFPDIPKSALQSEIVAISSLTDPRQYQPLLIAQGL